VWLDTPDRILPHQHQASIGYERQLGPAARVCRRLRAHGEPRSAAALQHQSRRSRRRRAHRADYALRSRGRRRQLGLTPFSSDVWIVEYIGETTYDGLNLQIEKRYSNNWGARFSYGLGHGRGNTNGTPTATNDFQVLGERNLETERGADQPRSAAHRDDQRPLRAAVAEGADRRRGRADDDRAAVHHPQQQHRREPQQRRCRSAAGGTYSGVGQNAITVENKGGRNGAYGRARCKSDLRAGYLHQAETGTDDRISFRAEVINLTNGNPTSPIRPSDMRRKHESS
jgi:hypothetical protein